MPVKWLETFSENTPGILVDINLKELIKQELSNTGDRPNIVIDGSSVPFLFNSKESCMQPAVTKIKIENFFEEIIAYGANVVVVLRGGNEKYPNQWFFKAREKFFQSKKCEAVSEIFKAIRTVTNFCCSETLASISNEHYTVLTSIKGTAEETAKISARGKCLAVLGQDSYYLIYEGIRFYIPLNTLDIETLNCKFFDRNELLKCLGLKYYQLPMFATLCGNDIVPYYYLKSFHERISGQKLSAPLLSVAEKVKNTSNDPYGCIQYMVNLIAHEKITKGLIKKSLDMYLKFEEIQPVNKLLKFVMERVRKCDWKHKLYHIFVHKEYYFSGICGIFDESLTAFELLRPLRKKLYGILLPSDDPTVKEYFVEEILLHNNQRAIPKTVSKTSNDQNPGLIELFRNRTPELNLLRWELFLSCISERFPEIRIVPENYLLPVMALHYLHVTVPSHFPRKKIFKQEFELEAFLLGVLLFKEFPRQRLENIEWSKPDLWELQLHTLYVEVCYILVLLNEVCGFAVSRQKACICNFYDGKLIHWIYNKMKRGATCDEFFENNMVLEALFYTFMDLIKTEL